MGSQRIEHNRVTFTFTFKASLVAKTVKTLPAVQEMWVQFLGLKDPLEKGIIIHSNILAW